MSKINKCPFCGDNNSEIKTTNSINCWVECLNCYAQSSAFIDVKLAIKSWNNVTPHAGIQKLIDRCRKREEDNHRPPFEQEAYALIAYDLEQLIKPEVSK